MIVEPIVLLLLAGAAYRLTHVLTGTDSLLEGSHRRLLGWAYEVDDCGNPLLDDCRDQIRRPGVGLLRSKTVDLLTCPFCTGFWVGVGLLCVWTTLWPWELGWHGWIIALAIAAVQSFATAIDGR